jgi:hypothetical protein
LIKYYFVGILWNLENKFFLCYRINEQAELYFSEHLKLNKMRNSIFFILAFFLVLFSCSEEKIKESQLLTINRESATDAIKSREYFSSIKAVPLEINPEILIGKIDNVSIKNNSIYLSSDGVLYRFDEMGKCTGKINKKGEGADEYRAIYDFEIPSEDEVWILNSAEKFFYKYNWNGELIEQVKFNANGNRMQFFPPDKACLYRGYEIDGENHSILNIIDLNSGEKIHDFLEIDPGKAQYLYMVSQFRFSPAYNKPGHGYYYDLFDENIYEITEDTVSIGYKINMYDKNIPVSFFKNDFPDISYFFQRLFRNDYACGRILIAESEERFLYSYYYERERHISLISKDKNSSIADFKNIGEDGIFSGFQIDFKEREIFVSDDKLIISLFPSELMEYA